MVKVFVILANLGGPNKKGEVRRFLFNLFNDKHIIPLPTVPRFILAHLISFFRASKSQKEYDKMGGSSPILHNTQKQADLLQHALGENFKVLVAMSYSHPFMEDAFAQIPKGSKVILLPLYPQYSITTTKSCIDTFFKVANLYNFHTIEIINSFFRNKEYVRSCADKIAVELRNIKDNSKKTVVLFSAHGIPKDFVQKMNDPYEEQIRETARLISSLLSAEFSFESIVCFQSRVGPKEWLKPYIQDVIPTLKDCNIIVFPIAFISEHLETLVELDHQYKDFATECGVAEYLRAGTPSECGHFIDALKNEVLKRID